MRWCGRDGASDLDFLYSMVLDTAPRKLSILVVSHACACQSHRVLRRARRLRGQDQRGAAHVLGRWRWAPSSSAGTSKSARCHLHRLPCLLHGLQNKRGAAGAPLGADGLPTTLLEVQELHGGFSIAGSYNVRI